MKILVINGPNLNLLGLREPALYGSGTYAELLSLLAAHAEKRGVEVSFFQSNHEGALVDAIQGALGTQDGIVINPGAYTHTSIALLDAVKAVGLPTVEVHITDPDSREPFRRISYLRPACAATIKGR
ncbi:MAG: type II 3-dehydroquinate dehydratase, partial [bacterium]